MHEKIKLLYQMISINLVADDCDLSNHNIDPREFFCPLCHVRTEEDTISKPGSGPSSGIESASGLGNGTICMSRGITPCLTSPLAPLHWPTMRKLPFLPECWEIPVNCWGLQEGWWGGGDVREATYWSFGVRSPSTASSKCIFPASGNGNQV